MDRALLAIVALITSALLGVFFNKLDVTSITSPLAKFLRNSELKLNIRHRRPEELHWRGMLLTTLVLLATLIAGVIFSLIFGNPVFDFILLTVLLPVGSTWRRINLIKKQLKIGNLPAARAQLTGTIFHHYAIMDKSTLARSAVEYTSIQFSEKIVAPIFWFMVMGISGLFLSVITTLLQETLAGAASKPAAFAKAARNAQIIFHYIPSRISALLWMLVVLFLPKPDWRGIYPRIQTGIFTSTPNQMALLSAASALNLSLGGAGSSYYNDRIGSDRANISDTDLTKCQFLFTLLCLLLFIGLGLVI